jgi:ABC-type multidrug transport system ATPase subunit
LKSDVNTIEIRSLLCCVCQISKFDSGNLKSRGFYTRNYKSNYIAMWKLREVVIENFKSVENVSLEFADGFTVIVGPNGSGNIDCHYQF